MSTIKHSLALEAVLVLLSFFAGFHTGERVGAATGSSWLGFAAGTLAFMGSGLLLFQLFPVHRSVTPSTGAQRPGPLWSGVASYLALFVPGYACGFFVAGRTGRVWEGGLAGALTVIAVAALFIRLELQAKRRGSAPARAEAATPPDDDLVWAEPRAFRSEDLQETKRLTFMLIFITLAAAGFFLWFANRNGMQPEITRRLLVTAAGIVVLFLGLLGFTRLMRVVVRITGKAIVLELGEDPAVHAFGDIDSCEIGKTLVGSRWYPVLVVKLNDGGRETFCVDDAVTPERLRAALERRGVRTRVSEETLSREALERGSNF